jgi:hypothetical protein
MYCTDSLSRHRPDEADDNEPFFVEPGQLYKLHTHSESGHVAETLLHSLRKQTNQEPPRKTYHRVSPPTLDGWCDLWDPDQWTKHAPAAVGEQGQIIKRDKDAYILKVFNSNSAPAEDDAHSVAVTETAHDPTQLMNKSVGYTTHDLHSSMMDRFWASLRKEWPILYDVDPNLGPFWKSGGHERWEYWIQDGLLWKSGLAGVRLCVPKDVDKGETLTEIHDSRLSTHPGLFRTLVKA